MSDTKRTDKELIESYRNGCLSDFELLVSRYQEQIYNYVFSLVKDRQLCDDIFQDTFVKAIVTLRKGNYTSTGKFGAWLTRIAHNLIIDYFRQDKNENTVSNDAQDYDLLNDASLADVNVEDSLINEQTLRDVRRLVDALPDNQREVVFMRYYQDLSFKEIADITGVSINTALGRMRYALINIRKMSQDKGISLTLAS